MSTKIFNEYLLKRIEILEKMYTELLKDNILNKNEINALKTKIDELTIYNSDDDFEIVIPTLYIEI